MNKKNTKLVNSMVTFLANVLTQLTAQERVYFFDDMERPFCRECGALKHTCKCKPRVTGGGE